MSFTKVIPNLYQIRNGALKKGDSPTHGSKLKSQQHKKKAKTKNTVNNVNPLDKTPLKYSLKGAENVCWPAQDKDLILNSTDNRNVIIPEDEWEIIE